MWAMAVISAWFWKLTAPAARLLSTRWKHSKTALVGITPRSAVFLVLLAISSTPVAAEEDGEEQHHGSEDDKEAGRQGLYVFMFVVVIVLSAAFERGQEWLIEKFKDQEDPGLRDMLLKMMTCLTGELMTLGFIGLLVFVALKSSLIRRLSYAFGLVSGSDMEEGEDPLAETFETVHMFIFAVMVCYIAQSGVLAYKGFAESSKWRDWEYMRVASQRPDETTLYSELMKGGYFVDEDGVLKMKKKVRQLGKWVRPLSHRNVCNVLQWRAIRHEFMFPVYDQGEEQQDDGPPIRHDENVHRLNKEDVEFFCFYEYLTEKLTEEFAELIEIKTPTWVMATFACLTLPLIVQAGPEWYSTVAAGVSLSLVLFTYFIGVNAYGIYDKITPKLPEDPILCMHLFRGSSPSALKRKHQMTVIRELSTPTGQSGGRKRSSRKLSAPTLSAETANYWATLPKRNPGGSEKRNMKFKGAVRKVQALKGRLPDLKSFGAGSTTGLAAAGEVKIASNGTKTSLTRQMLQRIDDVQTSFASLRQHLSGLEERVEKQERLRLHEPLIGPSPPDLPLRASRPPRPHQPSTTSVDISPPPLQTSMQDTRISQDPDDVGSDQDNRISQDPDDVGSDQDSDADDDAIGVVLRKDAQQVDQNGQEGLVQQRAFPRKLSSSIPLPQIRETGDSYDILQDVPQPCESMHFDKTETFGKRNSRKKSLVRVKNMKKLEDYVWMTYPNLADEEHRIKAEVSSRIRQPNNALVELSVRFKAIPGGDIPTFRRDVGRKPSAKKREFLKFLSIWLLDIPMKMQPNPQDLLFYFNELGPRMIRMALDTVLFFQAVSTAAMITVWFDSGAHWDVQQWVAFVLGVVAPVFNMLYLVPLFAGKLVIIRSVEYMKDSRCCDQVVAGAKKHRLLESLRLVQLAKLQGKLASLGDESGQKMSNDNFLKFKNKFDTCFTKKRKEQLHKTFVMLDEDRSGTISSKEMATVLNQIGYDEGSRVHSYAESLLTLVDVDDSKDISYDEYKVLMAMALLKDTDAEEREHCKALFNKFNVGEDEEEADEVVSIEELALAFAKLGAPIDEDTIAELVHQVFGSWKQSLDVEDFITFMKALEEKLEENTR